MVCLPPITISIHGYLWDTQQKGWYCLAFQTRNRSPKWVSLQKKRRLVTHHQGMLGLLKLH